MAESPSFLDAFDVGACLRKQAPTHKAVKREEWEGGFPHLIPSSFWNSDSVRMVTPNSLALSYFDPGSVPTTT